MIWFNIGQNVPPLSKPLLVTDGKNIVVAEYHAVFVDKVWLFPTNISADGGGGLYVDFEDSITHWTHLPNLPYKLTKE
jgi:hypothetical protein